MKTEDVNNTKLHIKSKHNGEIPFKYGSRECAKLMHSYANQRVIEELESLRNNYTQDNFVVYVKHIDFRIKELKL
jgi:hypothetical protein